MPDTWRTPLTSDATVQDTMALPPTSCPTAYPTPYPTPYLTPYPTPYPDAVIRNTLRFMFMHLYARPGLWTLWGANNDTTTGHDGDDVDCDDDVDHDQPPARSPSRCSRDCDGLNTPETQPGGVPVTPPGPMGRSCPVRCTLGFLCAFREGHQHCPHRCSYPWCTACTFFGPTTQSWAAAQDSFDVPSQAIVQDHCGFDDAYSDHTQTDEPVYNDTERTAAIMLMEALVGVINTEQSIRALVGVINTVDTGARSRSRSPHLSGLHANTTAADTGGGEPTASSDDNDENSTNNDRDEDDESTDSEVSPPSYSRKP
jgi:hypothetical protein